MMFLLKNFSAIIHSIRYMKCDWSATFCEMDTPSQINFNETLVSIFMNSRWFWSLLFSLHTNANVINVPVKKRQS